jgi:hypothetical protein
MSMPSVVIFMILKKSLFVLSVLKDNSVMYIASHDNANVEIKKMLEFLIDNIYVVVVGRSSNSLLEFPWVQIVPRC